MSLGVRLVLRGPTSIRASFASTPREPLLFLYPTWARNSSTETSALFTAAAASAVNEQSTEHKKRDAKAVDESLSQAQPRSRPPSITLHSSDWNDSSTTKRVPEGAMLDKPNNMGKGISGKGVFRKVETPDSSVEQKARRVQSRLAKHAAYEKRRESVLKAYQMEVMSKRRESAYIPALIPDWREVVATMDRNTPAQGKWLITPILVRVPDNSTKHLVHGLDDNIWDIGKRYGCSVAMGAPEVGDETYHVFYLSGSSWSISKTTIDVLAVAPSVKIRSNNASIDQGDQESVNTLNRTATELLEHQSGPGPIRRVVIEARQPRTVISPSKRAKPVTWDIDNFYDYVQAIVRTRSTNHIDHFKLPRGQGYQSEAITILHELFSDPNNELFISRAACHEALSYYVKTNSMPEVRTLFVRMERLNIPMEPQTFNIMLRGAAKTHDLKVFSFILRLMLARLPAPNAETWIELLKTVPDFRVRLYIVSLMKDKGLLQDLRALRGVLFVLVGPELEASLQNGQSTQEFITTMDSRYGPHWLSRSTATQMLSTLSRRGLVSRCWEVLQIMDSRPVRQKVDTVAVNIVLRSCADYRNFKGALKFLQAVPKDSHFFPDEDTYDILFRLAWKSKHYNSARLLWRYACLSANTTFLMRQRIFNALVTRQGSSIDEAKVHQLHSWLAGQIVTVSECHPLHVFTNHLQGQHATARKHDVTPNHFSHSDTSQALCKGSYSLMKSGRVKEAQRMVERDCKVGRYWAPVQPLTDLLAEAFHLDETQTETQPVVDKGNTFKDLSASDEDGEAEKRYGGQDADPDAKELEKFDGKIKTGEELSRRLLDAIAVPIKAKRQDLDLDMLWK